jgi:hypothetical protein
LQLWGFLLRKKHILDINVDGYISLYWFSVAKKSDAHYMTEDRRQKTEDRRQKTEDRRQKTTGDFDV